MLSFSALAHSGPRILQEDFIHSNTLRALLSLHVWAGSSALLSDVWPFRLPWNSGGGLEDATHQSALKTGPSPKPVTAVGNLQSQNEAHSTPLSSCGKGSAISAHGLRRLTGSTFSSSSQGLTTTRLPLLYAALTHALINRLAHLLASWRMWPLLARCGVWAPTAEVDTDLSPLSSLPSSARWLAPTDCAWSDASLLSALAALLAPRRLPTGIYA